MKRSQMHSWGDGVVFQHKTERSCGKCALVKVTRHEPGVRPWIEWWRDGERVNSQRTPACEPVLEEA